MSSESKEDVLRKYYLSHRMFHHISELNEHEDAKAERILTSVAFIALTAVTAFGVFVANQASFIITFGSLPFLFLWEPSSFWKPHYVDFVMETFEMNLKQKTKMILKNMNQVLFSILNKLHRKILHSGLAILIIM